MRRATLLLSLLLAVVLAVPASSQEHHAAAPDAGGQPASAAQPVSIGFSAVRPERLDLVTGETVRWTNDSVRVHTVTADDESFDSGRLAVSQAFTRRFTTAGEVAYHCRLHPSIKGVVAVHDLRLDPPAIAASAGKPFALTGRASAALPTDTAVSIEGDTGEGFGAVGATTVQADGTFSERLLAPANGRYRAVAGGLASEPVDLVVLDRRISLSAKRARGRVVLSTAVTPAARGGHVVLQLFLPERFGWWPVQGARLDVRSAASFELRTRRHLRVRVRLTLPDGATALATSRTLRVGPTLGGR